MKTNFSSIRKVYYIRWVARILGTLLVAFFLFFFIPDIVTKGGRHISDFGHGAVTILFLLGQVGLLVAWQWEVIGGFLAASSILLASLLNLFWVHAGQNTYITFIWLLPAFLFLYCWRRTKRQT